MKKEAQQVNPYPIRLTPTLKEKLQESAKKNGRSLNAEMLLRLEETFSTKDGEKNRVEQIVANYLKKQGLIEGDKTI